MADLVADSAFLPSRRALWAGGEPIANRLMAKALANPELVSLAAGFVDQATLPVEPAQAALEAIWSNPTHARAALQYGTTVGHAPLREAILQRFLAAEGAAAEALHVSLGQIVVTAGSNQMLFLAADALMDPGDILLCGDPSYYVFLGTLRNLGVAAEGVATDDDGIVPEAVEERLRQLEAAGQLDRVKAIYVTSYFDNPTGASMPLARRQAILALAQRWSRRHRLHVIEDVAYRELRYYGPDVPSLRALDTCGATVIQVGSFSKSFSPGIRVGWGVLPPDLVAPVLSLKGNIDFGSPHFNQTLMATVLGLGRFDDHVEQLQARYRGKLDATLAALTANLGGLRGVHWIKPSGGLYVWVTLPDEVDTGLDGALFAHAVAEGVLYIPGDYCYPRQEAAPRNRLRLTFGTAEPASIARGVEALGRAIRRVLR